MHPDSPDPLAPNRPPSLQWPAPSPVRPLAWAAVLVVHGAALTGLAAAYWPPKSAPQRPALSVQLLPSPEEKPQPSAHLPFAVSLESPSTVMLPVPTWAASAPSAEELDALAGTPLVVSVAPPEFRDTPWPALGPEALEAAPLALQLPDDKLRFLVRPPVGVALRAGQARVALRFEADGRVRRVELVRSSGRQDWDEQAIGAWQSTRIEPVLRDGRAVEVYTEMEQALPLR